MAAIYILATVINMAMIIPNLRAVKLRSPSTLSGAKALWPATLAGGVLRSARQEDSGEAQEGKELNSIFTVARMGKVL